MFAENVLSVLQRNLSDIKSLVEAIPGDHLCDQSSSFPPETLCHPIWTLGHLCGSLNGMREELRDDFSLHPGRSKEWDQLYGQYSDPQADPHIYHSKDELLSKLDFSFELVKSRMLQIDRKEWEGPMPDERYHEIFPSLAHVTANNFIEHSSTHLKLLILWRFYLLRY
ncbi:MAG: hypothetical protein PF447_06070 [Spirochaetaceae bacterium]|jgi:hypothetical protein|nr:hypothetical protein [Spirochaetaceae bacterium]